MKFKLIEDWIFESKADEQRFIDKFGEDRLNSFKKQHSNIIKKWDTKHGDMTWVIANLDTFLLDRVLSTTRNASDKEQSELDKIINSEEAKEAKKIYDKDGFEIYKIMSVAASIKYGLVVGGKSKWCTSGGYFDGKKNGGIYKEAEYYYNKYLRERYDGYYICFAPNHKKYNISLLQHPIGDKVSDIWEGETDEEIGAIPGLNENIIDPDTGVIIYGALDTNAFKQKLINKLKDYFDISEDKIKIKSSIDTFYGIDLKIDNTDYILFSEAGAFNAFKNLYQEYWLYDLLQSCVDQIEEGFPWYITGNIDIEKCKKAVREDIIEDYEILDEQDILGEIESIFNVGDNIDGIILTQDILDGYGDIKTIEKFRKYLMGAKISLVEDNPLEYWKLNLAHDSDSLLAILDVDGLLSDLWHDYQGEHAMVLSSTGNIHEIEIDNQTYTLYER